MPDGKIDKNPRECVIVGFSGVDNLPSPLRESHLSIVGHDASVALIKDGQLVAAAEEERFNREKHTAHFPINAIEWALSEAGVTSES